MMKLTVKPLASYQAGQAFQVRIDTAGTVDNLVEKITEASTRTVTMVGEGCEETLTYVDLPREKQRLVWNAKEFFAPSSAAAGRKALAELGISEGDTVHMVPVESTFSPDGTWSTHR